jgi:hypothetical protein
MQSLKLLSILILICSVSIIIFYSIWQAPAEICNPALPAETSKQSEPTPLFEKENFNAVRASAIKIIDKKGNPLAKLPKVFLKIAGDMGERLAAYSQGKEEFFEKDFNADGAFGLKFDSANKKIQFTPHFGYTLDFQIQKAELSETLLRIVNWRGPYLGLNTTTKLGKHLDLDAAYSFHWVRYNKIQMGILAFEGPGLSPIGGQMQNGLGHAGLIGLKMKAGKGWQFGANCRYRQLRTLRTDDLSTIPVIPLNPAEVQQLHAFQATAEIGYQF